MEALFNTGATCQISTPPTSINSHERTAINAPIRAPQLDIIKITTAQVEEKNSGSRRGAWVPQILMGGAGAGVTQDRAEAG